jgi:hypothetical protein
VVLVDELMGLFILPYSKWDFFEGLKPVFRIYFSSIVMVWELCDHYLVDRCEFYILTEFGGKI